MNDDDSADDDYVSGKVIKKMKVTRFSTLVSWKGYEKRSLVPNFLPPALQTKDRARLSAESADHEECATDPRHTSNEESCLTEVFYLDSKASTIASASLKAKSALEKGMPELTL